jgi:predicted nucleotidyltransferase
VAYGGERIVVDHHGKGLIALVPVGDLARLAEAETVGTALVPNRESCLSLLRERRAELRKAGVRRIALFGSVANNRATADSDVDLLVELDPRAHVGLIEFVDLRNRFVALFGRDVDLVSSRALDAKTDAHILEEAVYAF